MIRPFWTKDEWGIIFSHFTGKDHSDSISKLEKALCELTGMEFGVAVNRGKSGIQLALEALQLPSGSEVIIPSFCSIHVIYGAIHAGLEPVLVDIDRDFNVSAISVRAAISPSTRVIIMPHLSGKYVEDAEEILSLAKANNIKVIDDACQAFGLVVNGKWAGTLGDIGIYSFGIKKTIFGPGGGALLTNDPQVINYCKQRILSIESHQKINLRVINFLFRFVLRKITYPILFIFNTLKDLFVNKGWVVKYKIPSNEIYQISDIEAAIAYSLVTKWKTIVDQQRLNATALLDAETWEHSYLHPPSPANNTFANFIVTTGKSPEETIKVKRYFESAGIEAGTTYTPLHLQKTFQTYRSVNMTVTNMKWQEAFYLPMGSVLGASEIERIKRNIRHLTNKDHQI